MHSTIIKNYFLPEPEEEPKDDQEELEVETESLTKSYRSYYDAVPEFFSISPSLLAMVLSDAFISEEKALSRALISFSGFLVNFRYT
ncbi:unnamed protein product [Rhizophagus irregularis]|nr:unnamed protein product [Rhizophagus irregularis]